MISFVFHLYITHYTSAVETTFQQIYVSRLTWYLIVKKMCVFDP